MISMILAAGALIWMCHPMSLVRVAGVGGHLALRSLEAHRPLDLRRVGGTRVDRDQRGRGDLQDFTTIPEPGAHHILLAAAAAKRAPRAYHGGAEHRPSNIRARAFGT